MFTSRRCGSGCLSGRRPRENSQPIGSSRKTSRSWSRQTFCRSCKQPPLGRPEPGGGVLQERREGSDPEARFPLLDEEGLAQPDGELLERGPGRSPLAEPGLRTRPPGRPRPEDRRPDVVAALGGPTGPVGHPAGTDAILASYPHSRFAGIGSDESFKPAVGDDRGARVRRRKAGSRRGSRGCQRRGPAPPRRRRAPRSPGRRTTAMPARRPTARGTATRTRRRPSRPIPAATAGRRAAGPRGLPRTRSVRSRRSVLRARLRRWLPTRTSRARAHSTRAEEPPPRFRQDEPRGLLRQLIGFRLGDQEGRRGPGQVRWPAQLRGVHDGPERRTRHDVALRACTAQPSEPAVVLDHSAEDAVGNKDRGRVGSGQRKPEFLDFDGHASNVRAASCPSPSKAVAQACYRAGDRDARAPMFGGESIDRLTVSAERGPVVVESARRPVVFGV